MQIWQLQEAKAHLSEVIQKALNEGPQAVSLQGRPVAVVLSRTEYDRLTHPKPNFVTFLRESPLHAVELELNRDTSLTRETAL